MKNSRLLIIIAAVGITACNNPTLDEHASPILEPPPSEITAKQQAAFDAMNTLQVNTQGHLYCTFVGSQHPCTPPDTTFTLSQSELLMAFSKVVEQYGQALTTSEQDSLTALASTAAEEYTVEQCFGCEFELDGDSIASVSTPGKWVIRSILDRRDMVIEW